MDGASAARECAAVEYLGGGVAAGRFEIMLHGYSHDEPHGRPEFAGGDDWSAVLSKGAATWKKCSTPAFACSCRPTTRSARRGLRAIARAGLHLGGTAGLRHGGHRSRDGRGRRGSIFAAGGAAAGAGVPWVLDLGDHREIPGTR